ncbi:MAG: ferritin-like protein [Gemmatimonadetes bacterium]|nr:ferritin-like protein [Gemmatimonadota bacterium]
MRDRTRRHLQLERKKPEELSWTDYLLMLLHVGAEIEHALMVEYLYAAYSLGGDQVPKKHHQHIRDWRNAILTVAREEMGHLLTVQNLLTLLGGPISLDREDYPWDSPFYPFPFKLSPLTMDSLAHYVYAEMPPDEMMADATLTEKRIREEVRRRVEGDRGPHHPVSEIYDAIIEIIEDPELIPDSAFRSETFGHQASWDEWGKNYRADPEAEATKRDDERRAHVIVAQMATRTEAVAGLRMVAGQGEAPHLRHPKKPDKPDEPSHFERFAEVYAGYEKIGKLDEKDRWAPTRPIPVNPTTVRPPKSKSKDKGTSSRDAAPPTFIENDASRRWAELFNIRYRMLLTYLSHTYRLGRTTGTDEPGPRGLMLHRIFGEMYNLKTIAGLLVRMPLTDDPKDPARAGPPFQMPYTLSLPADEVDCWRTHVDLLQSSGVICDDLLDRGGPADGARYLKSLRELDEQAMAWIDRILADMGSARRVRS